MKRRHLRSTFEQREALRRCVDRDEDITSSELDLIENYEERDSHIREQRTHDEMMSSVGLVFAIVIILLVLVALYPELKPHP